MSPGKNLLFGQQMIHLYNKITVHMRMQTKTFSPWTIIISLTLIAPGFWPPVTPQRAHSAMLPKSYFLMEFRQTVKSIA